MFSLISAIFYLMFIDSQMKNMKLAKPFRFFGRVFNLRWVSCNSCSVNYDYGISPGKQFQLSDLAMRLLRKLPVNTSIYK